MARSRIFTISYGVGNLALHIASKLIIKQPSHQPLPCITLALTTTKIIVLKLYSCSISGSFQARMSSAAQDCSVVQQPSSDGESLQSTRIRI